MLYSVRSERMLMEQMQYNLLFRWFVGLNMDDQVWDVTVFTKNRDRLLEGSIAQQFFQAVIEQARAKQPLRRAFQRRWNVAGSVGGRQKHSEEIGSTEDGHG